jgi:DNA polymerase-3 subunit epsilon
MSPGLESLGWRAARLVVVDLETTGLDPQHDELISFAALPIVSGRIRPGELTTALVRPQRAPAPGGIRIHGLRERDLAAQPPLQERRALIRDALQDAVMVAHCARIERRFLAAAFADGDWVPSGPVLDTMLLGAAVLRDAGTECPDDPALGFLATALGLPVHRPHHADGDALTTAQVFLALAGALSRPERDATIGELARVRPRRRRRRRRQSAR